MNRNGDAIDFLLHASKKSLQSFTLFRMSHARDMEKQLREIIHELAEEIAWAKLAALLMEEQRLSGIGGHPIQEQFDFVGGARAEIASVDSATNSFRRHAAD